MALSTLGNGDAGRERGGIYVLVDAGTVDTWRFVFVPS
jgi:hypothetical protein